MLDVSIMQTLVSKYVGILVHSNYSTIEIEENLNDIIVEIQHIRDRLKPQVEKQYLSECLNHLLGLLQDGDDIEEDMKQLIKDLTE